MFLRPVVEALVKRKPAIEIHPSTAPREERAAPLRV